MAKFDFDYGLYTSLGELSVPEVKSYLRDMKEREKHLDWRLGQIDHETETLSSAIQRATFQKGCFGEQIDETEYGSKSDKLYYILEHANLMLEEQAMDIAIQTMQINAEKRKISYIKIAIEDISKSSRIILKDKYIDRSEWGVDEEQVKQYRKEKGLINTSIKSRNLRAALEELTIAYNKIVSVFNNKTRKRIDVSRVTITEE